MNAFKIEEVYTVGEFTYYVNTPNDGTFYFYDKKSALEFIEFYKSFKRRTKHPHILGMNVQSSLKKVD